MQEDGKYTFNGTVLTDIPSSFAYLSCLGNSIRTNPDHLAIAGVTRGRVLYNFEPNQDDIITNKEAEDYQPKNGVRVNPITNIRPYGYCIWGNATLRDNSLDESRAPITGKDGLVASSYLNIRNMVSTVQKAAYSASKACMFEQNTDTLWVKFQNLLMPTLDSIKSNNGISNYKIIKKQIPQSYKMSAIIKLYPIYAVDEIDIEILEKDLRIDTYRASGAGGQHVNKTESAIRITHAPTGIVVQCQNDRSQHKNKASALKMLKSKLYELERQKKDAEANSGDKSEIGWGHQIRSYVLAPYQQVKDTRSNLAYTNTDAILDGDIDEILEGVLIHINANRA